MEEEKITKYVFESVSARFERTIKRLSIALLVAIVLIFVSNMAWLYAWTRYDYSSTEYSYQQDGQGVNVIGDENHVYDAGTNPDNPEKGAQEEGRLEGD